MDGIFDFVSAPKPEPVKPGLKSILKETFKQVGTAAAESAAVAAIGGLTSIAGRGAAARERVLAQTQGALIATEPISPFAGAQKFLIGGGILIVAAIVAAFAFRAVKK